MTKQFWINLPVKDIARSREFFTKLGFNFSTSHGNTPVSLAMPLGEKNVIVMLFEQNVFKGFSGNAVTDTNASNEVLLSIDAESPEEVDELTSKAEAAGGKVFGKPGWNQGWMYGSGFTDPDGHRWNVLYMDMSKMPK